jgi:hypothetical protein
MCGVKINENASREAAAETNVCSNCAKGALILTKTDPRSQSMDSPLQLAPYPFVYSNLEERQQRPQESLNIGANKLVRTIVEAIVLLVGFALIGFAGLELGATIAGLINYANFILLSLPIIALCETVFVLAIMHEYGSIRFWL